MLKVVPIGSIYNLKYGVLLFSNVYKVHYKSQARPTDEIGKVGHVYFLLILKQKIE